MSKNRAAADRAMAISDSYKKIIRLRGEIYTELLRIAQLVRKDAHPDHPVMHVDTLRTSHDLAFHREFIGQQAAWHNVAFSRGYFDIEEGPKKLSKSDQT